jgi:hypothetical protein
VHLLLRPSPLFGVSSGTCIVLFCGQLTAIEPLRIPFSKIILMENYPKDYCLFREIASARIKQGRLTSTSSTDGEETSSYQGGALE